MNPRSQPADESVPLKEPPMPTPKRILRGMASLPSALDARLRGRSAALRTALPGARLPLDLPHGTGAAVASTLHGGSTAGGGGTPGGGDGGDPDAPAYPEQFAPLDAVRGLYAQTSTLGGDSFGNTASRTDFASTYTFAADSLGVGSSIRGWAAGRMGTVALSPPSLRFYISLGGVDVVQTLDIPLAASLADAPWLLQFCLTVRVGGASGSVMPAGSLLLLRSSISSAGAISTITGAVAIDLSVDCGLVVGAKFSAADVANEVVLEQFVVDLTT
jgi:hypothetical protein